KFELFAQFVPQQTSTILTCAALAEFQIARPPLLGPSLHLQLRLYSKDRKLTIERKPNRRNSSSVIKNRYSSSLTGCVSTSTTFLEAKPRIPSSRPGTSIGGRE